MKICPNCEKAVDDSASFCLFCDHVFEKKDDDCLNRTVSGRFRIISKLGEGGMGEVYRAEQMPIGRMVALKLLRHALTSDAKQVARFKREAQAITKLSHPNTVIIHDFGQDGDLLFIAMEELVGNSLASVIKKEHALLPSRACRIMTQICASLAEAHKQGIIHRDLKPENIMLIERGGIKDFVKVLDFGIAKVLHVDDSDPQQEALTQSGAIFGTPQYMSPEQIKGQVIDARSDIYAMGLILYEMLAGHRPFTAGTPMEMMTKHLAATPDPIEPRSLDPVESQIFTKLEEIALKALAKNPDERQQTAQEMLELLVSVSPELGMLTSTGFMPQTQLANLSEHGESRHRALLLGISAAVLVIALGIVGVFLLKKPSDPEPQSSVTQNQPSEEALLIAQKIKEAEAKLQKEKQIKDQQQRELQKTAQQKAALEKKLADQQAALEKQRLAEQQNELEKQKLAEQKAELEKQLAEQRAALEKQLAEQQAALEKQKQAELQAEREKQKLAEQQAELIRRQSQKTDNPPQPVTPVKPPVANTGHKVKVLIETHSKNATLLIDDKEIGPLPMTISISPGKYKMTVRTEKGSQFRIINLQESNTLQNVKFPL